MPLDIAGGVAVVTGASSGVGAACAQQFAERGCHVVINYSRNDAGAERTQQACASSGVETLVIKADVADDAACRQLAQQVDDKWGRADILINNAGTTKFCQHDNLEGLTQEDFQQIYAVNVIGAYQMTRAIAPIMQRSERGSIVNVASIAGVTGLGSSIAYAASKGAMITMTLSLARVFAPKIRVNAVCPGFIQGDWLRKGWGDDVYEERKKKVESMSPLGITATPESIADAILYFATRADVATGETMLLDAGMHLNTVPLGRR